MKTSRILRFLSTVALVIGFSTAAHAQATRTWVSGVGDDANPCSRTAPCKTFAGAISKTADHGEINCLDSGGFGAVTITKSITIKAEGCLGGLLVSGTNGIVINSATAKVVLEGLDIEGVGGSPSGGGLNGINIVAASKVFVIRTTIRGFLQNGINMTSTSAHLFVDKSFIQNNGQSVGSFGGINVGGTSNIASLTNTAFHTNGTGGSGFALNASAASAIVGVQNSVLNDSPIGIGRVAGAQVISVGPSNLLTGSGSFSSTILFQ